MPEREPCPLCGAAPIYDELAGCMRCQSCGLRGPTGLDYTAALNHWDTRPGEDAAYRRGLEKGRPSAEIILALRVLLNHVEPGWLNCVTTVSAWLDDLRDKCDWG